PPALHPFPTRRSSDLEHLPLGEGRKPSALLLRRAPLEERHRHHRLDREDARQSGRCSPEGFIQQTERDDIPSLAAILRRQTAAQDRKSTRLNSSHVSI